MIAEVIMLIGVINKITRDNFTFKTNIATNVPIIVVKPERAVAKLSRKPSVIMSMSLIILEIRSPCEEVSIKLIGTF